MHLLQLYPAVYSQALADNFGARYSVNKNYVVILCSHMKSI